MPKNLLGIMLASTLSLSALVGCNGSASLGTNQQVAASAASSSDSGAETASSMSEERSMDDYATVAGQEDTQASAYRVTALDASTATTAAASGTAGATGGTATSGAAVTGSASTTTSTAMSQSVIDAILVKIKMGQTLTAQEMADARNAFKATVALAANVRADVQSRATAREASIKGRLDKLADQRAKLRAALKSAAYVNAGDGTSTKTIEIDDQRTVNGKSAARHCKLVKTVKSDNRDLLSWQAEFKQTLPGGTTRTSTRNKTLLADGSYLVVFHSELTLPNGRSRMADWTKIIAADGSVAGKGMIVWKDKTGTVVKTSAITLGGSQDKATATVDGSSATVAMQLDGQVTVKGDDGQTKMVDADSAVGDLDASADASTSASANTTAAGASTNASANASVNASAK